MFAIPDDSRCWQPSHSASTFVREGPRNSIGVRQIHSLPRAIIKVRTGVWDAIPEIALGSTCGLALVFEEVIAGWKYPGRHGRPYGVWSLEPGVLSRRRRG